MTLPAEENNNPLYIFIVFLAFAILTSYLTSIL